jgi:septal ring-binding cell division protein DamX
LTQISDFIPRSDALKKNSAEQAATAQQESAPAEQTVDPVEQVQTEPVVTTRPMQDLVTEQTVVAENGATAFSSWQRDHPNHWSYQVIGTSNRHKLDEFITRHQLSQWPFSIVKTQVHGADWWVVLVGLYDSRDSAIANRDQLPAVLADGAWVRQINSIIGDSR